MAIKESPNNKNIDIPINNNFVILRRIPHTIQKQQIKERIMFMLRILLIYLFLFILKSQF